MFKLKLIVATAVLVLGAGGVAMASSGNVPGTVKSLLQGVSGSGGSASQGEYQGAAGQQYGGGVSTVARDKEEMGTKTLPNGMEIENHGMAVSQAAKDQNGDEGESDQPDPPETHMPNGGGNAGSAGGQSAGQMQVQTPPAPSSEGQDNGTTMPQPPAAAQSHGQGHGRGM